MICKVVTVQKIKGNKNSYLPPKFKGTLGDSIREKSEIAKTDINQE